MTDLIEVKTVDLAGEALAWAVAKAEGLEPKLEAPHYGNGWRVFCDTTFGGSKRYNPQEDWALGGPLIDKYYPTFSFVGGLTRAEVILASGESFPVTATNYLVAACRTIAAARHGETVQVPKELMP